MKEGDCMENVFDKLYCKKLTICEIDELFNTYGIRFAINNGVITLDEER
jgi:hypothetical protein